MSDYIVVVRAKAMYPDKKWLKFCLFISWMACFCEHHTMVWLALWKLNYRSSVVGIALNVQYHHPIFSTANGHNKLNSFLVLSFLFTALSLLSNILATGVITAKL
jgi:hypothetical protein